MRIGRQIEASEKVIAAEKPVRYGAGVEGSFFSHASFKELMSRIRANGWAGPLRDWHGQNGTILRHDVDLSIQRAHELAALERECGVRSSYYILTTGGVYNPMTARNRTLLREMAAEGFEIGLHFDPTVYGGARDEVLREKAHTEAAMLAEATGVAVTSVSIHCPSVHGQMPLIEGFANAYDPKVFQSERYWSDSCMTPRKEIGPVLERSATGVIQILTHPFHFSAHGEGYEKLIPEHVEGMLAELDETFRRDNYTYREVFPQPLGSKLA